MQKTQGGRLVVLESVTRVTCPRAKDTWGHPELLEGAALPTRSRSSAVQPVRENTVAL